MTNFTMPNPDRKTFLQSVADHQLTVLHDQGVYRHLRFAKPGTSDMAIDIITYPWHLVFSGDMGTFVFSRLEDMIQFFQADRQPDFGYWAEKLQAEDTNGGYKGYSKALFEKAIKERLDEIDASDDLREAVEDEVLNYADDGQEAYNAETEFRWNGSDEIFTDWWEVDCMEYTYRYVWACYAIQHVLNLYRQVVLATDLSLPNGLSTNLRPAKIALGSR